MFSLHNVSAEDLCTDANSVNKNYGAKVRVLSEQLDDLRSNSERNKLKYEQKLSEITKDHETQIADLTKTMHEMSISVRNV